LDQLKSNWENRENDDVLEFTSEDQKEYNKLLDNPFGDWTRKDYNMFVAASAKFGRNNIDQIARDTGLAVDEVKAYHKKFWNEYFKIENVDQIIKKIERGEEEIVKRNMTQNVFKWLCREECPELGIALNINGNSDAMNEEDKHLLILSLNSNFD